MNKSYIKVFSLITVLALVLMALPTQRVLAAGEPAAPSQLEAQASYPGDTSPSPCLGLTTHSTKPVSRSSAVPV